MARASTPTLLSLDRFAEIMGLSPVHFAGARGSAVWTSRGTCGEVWPQYQWQSHNDMIGREDVARAIKSAEDDIANEIGSPLAPRWFAQEVARYPRSFKNSRFGLGEDIHGRAKALKAKWGHVIAPGRRATSLIQANATVTYSDDDGDGFDETATIVVTDPGIADLREVQVFTAGKEAKVEWMIRPAISKDIAGGNLVITLRSWLLIDPDMWEEHPGPTGIPVIDADDPASYVSTVDLYRVFNDPAQVNAQFVWESRNSGGLSVWCARCGGSGCASCGLTTQDGCLGVRDPVMGLVSPQPATYDADAGQWRDVALSPAYEPDVVKLWYYAGMLSNEYLSGMTDEPLSDYWATTIAHMAAARMDTQSVCACNIAHRRFEYVAQDLMFLRNAAQLGYISPDLITNPFGTRMGEYLAWQRVSKGSDDVQWDGGGI